MSDDLRIAYLNARAAYTAALKVVKAYVYLVKGVGEQLGRSPGAFIESTLAKKPSGGMNTAWDLTHWPSVDDLRRDAESLKATFEECNRHWDALSDEERVGPSPPPKSIGSD